MHTFSVHALPSSHWALMEHAVGAGVGAAVTPVGKLKLDMVVATFLSSGHYSSRLHLVGQRDRSLPNPDADH